jgi:hypothetical protein
MKTLSRSFVFAVLVFIEGTWAQGGGKEPALAGWYNLLPPSQQRLHPMYQHPVVGKTKGGDRTYSQTARFDAMTDLPRSFRVTVARDPAFKTRYGEKATRNSSATALVIGKRAGWLWKDGKKVVIPLGEDKAVILETEPYSVPLSLVEYAKTLDYDRIEKALAHPPRTDFTPTLQTFRALKKGDPAGGFYDWAGPAKCYEQVGKKEGERVRWRYSLKDGSKVVVTTAGGKIEAVTYASPEGRTLDLAK